MAGTDRAVQVGVAGGGGSGKLIYAQVQGGYFQVGAMRVGGHEIDVVPLAELVLAESGQR